MADILPFARSEIRRKEPIGEPAGIIVIFPGIRVEYTDRPTPPTGKGRARRRRRSGADKAALA